MGQLCKAVPSIMKAEQGQEHNDVTYFGYLEELTT